MNLRHPFVVIAGVLAVLAVAGLAALSTQFDSSHARADDTVYFKGFFVTQPLVAQTDPRVRQMLPTDAGFHWMQAGGGVGAATLRLTWRPADQAYSYLYDPATGPSHVLYKAALLDDNFVLWQTADSSGTAEAPRYQVFVTQYTAGTIVPISFKQAPLAKALKAGHATLAAVDTPSSVVGIGGMAKIAGGDADAIRRALADTVTNLSNTAVSVMAVPAGQ